MHRHMVCLKVRLTSKYIYIYMYIYIYIHTHTFLKGTVMIKSVDCIDIFYRSENGYPPKIQWILIISPMFYSCHEPVRSMPKLAEPPVSPKESDGTSDMGQNGPIPPAHVYPSRRRSSEIFCTFQKPLISSRLSPLDNHLEHHGVS